MASLFSDLSNEELRGELERNDVNVGPITPSTRKVYEIKLMKIAQSKGDNAEDYVQNISLNSPNSMSNAKNMQSSLQNGSPIRDTIAAASTAVNGGSHNGSPMVSQMQQNGDVSKSPSNKLQSAIHGNKSSLNNTQEVFASLQTPGSFGTVAHPKDGQHGDEHNHSSDEDDANESARVLTPDEVAKFRSAFSSLNATNDLISGIASSSAGNSSYSFFSPLGFFKRSTQVTSRRRSTATLIKPEKNRFAGAASTLLLIVALLLLVGIAVFVIYRTNLVQFRSFYGSNNMHTPLGGPDAGVVPAPAFKDEI